MDDQGSREAPPRRTRNRTKQKQKTTDTSATDVTPKRPIRQKIQNIEDEDGWTHVRRNGMSKPTTEDHNNPTQFSDKMEHCDMSLSEVLEEHKWHKARWIKSDACAQLIKILDTFKTSHASRSLKNVICLGLGSVTGIHMRYRTNAHIQLCALKTIREVLELNDLDGIMQDPVFNPVDISFLLSKGYAVVDTPEAFKDVNEDSLVYMIHPPKSMYGAVLRGAMPKFFISQALPDLNDEWIAEIDLYEEVEESLVQVSDLGSRYEVLQQHYAITPFPSLEQTFSGVAIHSLTLE